MFTSTLTLQCEPNSDLIRFAYEMPMQHLLESHGTMNMNTKGMHCKSSKPLKLEHFKDEFRTRNCVMLDFDIITPQVDDFHFNHLRNFLKGFAFASEIERSGARQSITQMIGHGFSLIDLKQAALLIGFLSSSVRCSTHLTDTEKEKAITMILDPSFQDDMVANRLDNLYFFPTQRTIEPEIECDFSL